eukprot:gene31808-40118_t
MVFFGITLLKDPRTWQCGIAVAKARFAIAAYLLGVIVTRQNHKRKERRLRRKLAVTKLSDLDRKTVEWICEELPPWVKFPDYERVEWLNKLVAKLWPHISNATGTTVLDVVGPILKKSVPKGLASVEFTKLTLGTLAPQFGGIKAFSLQSSEIILDLNIKWGGDPDISLSVKPSLLAYAVGLPIQLTDFQLFGTMRIVLSPLLDQFPCFGAISYAFIEDPHVDFTLNVGSGDIMSIPGLNSMID